MLNISLMGTTKQKPTINKQRERETDIRMPLKKVIKPQRKRAKERNREKLQKLLEDKTINTMAISTYLSIITLPVNGLNHPTKSHRKAEEINSNTLLCTAYKRHTLEVRTH